MTIFSGASTGRLAARLRRLALLPDEDAVALVLDLPDRQRIKRRRARRLAAAQIEAGVMPGAADAVADHEPFRERPVIMAAMRVDGENLRPGAHQQDLLVADMAEQGLAAEFAWCDALREIRPGRRGLLFSHGYSLHADVEATAVASRRNPLDGRWVKRFPGSAAG